MKTNYGSLGPHKTTLEGLTPQQVLIRDELVDEGVLTEGVATDVATGVMTLEEGQHFEHLAVRAIVAAAKNMNK